MNEATQLGAVAKSETVMFIGLGGGLNFPGDAFRMGMQAAVVDLEKVE